MEHHQHIIFNSEIILIPFKSLAKDSVLKSIITKYELYHLFEPDFSSTFYEIATCSHFDNYELTGFLAYHTQSKAYVGLYLFLDFQSNDIEDYCGQIHLFTNRNFRGLGLAKEAVIQLDKQLSYLANRKFLMRGLAYNYKDSTSLNTFNPEEDPEILKIFDK